jgi:hypothetical protein
MRFLCGLFILTLAAAAFAYHPVPVTKSAAETALREALTKTDVDSVRLRLAREALERNPEDIPLGRMAQDVLLKQMDDAVGYFKNQAQGSESVAAHYLYGRAADDTTVTAEEARWILSRDPSNFWGHLLAGIAEWDKSKFDTAVVHRQFLAAVTSDPSRPEGYLYLGYFFQDEERWPEAREVLDAGALTDSSSQAIRDARLTTYAELRDADAFFKLIQGMYSTRPLEADMPLANGTSRLTGTDLRGRPTVLEYWAYT